MMSYNSVVVKNLTKSFTTKSRDEKDSGLFKRSRKITRNVLEGVSFEIKEGEVFGIIGRNGSGKSTLLKILSKIMKPDSGTVELRGKIASILELGMGFHSDLSGRENIYLKGSMYGFTKEELNEKVDDIVSYAGLEDYIDLPVRVYSSGMSSRLAFAIMINVDADVVILDEVLSTGDLAFNTKSGAHLLNMKSKGKTVILVSHSMGTMRNMCDRVAWIDNGVIREIGPANVVCGKYESEMSNSLDVIKELAESGDPASQNKLGRMYRDGIRVKANKRLARDWFEKAANRDYDLGKINLADLLIESGEPEGRDLALNLYASAARRGNVDARTKFSILASGTASDTGKEVVSDFKKLLPFGNPSLYLEYADLLLKTAWCEDDRREALKWFLKSAKSGNAVAMYRLALMYREGIGTIPQPDEYLTWLESAAVNGHVTSQFILGSVYRDGQYVESNEQKAFEWYLMAAKNNHSDAMYHVAVMYREGKGVECNDAEANLWFRLYSEHRLFGQINTLSNSFSSGRNGVYGAGTGMKWYSINAERNHPESMYQLGLMKLSGVIGQSDPQGALSLFKAAMARGHVNSAVRISDMYCMGLVDGSVLEGAVTELERSADGGNPWAAHAIGNMYADGIAVAINGEKAVRYLKIAAGAISGANRKIGEIYRDGICVPQNLEEAARWFKRGVNSGNVFSAVSLINMYGAGTVGTDWLQVAVDSLEKLCNEGNVVAMRTLGGMLLDGAHIESNVARAIRILNAASNLGDTQSMHTLGEVYRDGFGIEKDCDEALEWFKNSAIRGNLNSTMAIIEMYGAGDCNADSFKWAYGRLEQMANGGKSLAMRFLGTLHLEGKLVPANPVVANMWFEKAAGLGDTFSKNFLKTQS